MRRKSPAAVASSSAALRPSRPKMGVNVAPGLTVLTRIPRGSNSAEKERASERTAALVVLYTAMPGQPLLVTVELFKMMAAPSFKYGRAFWTVKDRPLKLISTDSSKNASVVSARGDAL